MSLKYYMSKYLVKSYLDELSTCFCSCTVLALNYVSGLWLQLRNPEWMGGMGNFMLPPWENIRLSMMTFLCVDPQYWTLLLLLLKCPYYEI